MGVARLFRGGGAGGTYRHTNTIIETFSTNKFRLYFSGENRITSRSLGTL